MSELTMRREQLADFDAKIRGAELFTQKDLYLVTPGENLRILRKARSIVAKEVSNLETTRGARP